MYYYEDLVKEGGTGAFCRKAVDAFMMTEEYANAKAGEAYFAKHNITIEKFKKWLYTVSGNKFEDIFSSNYKIKTLFFRRLVTSQVMYVLKNGVILSNENNKKKLGDNFDHEVQFAAKRAMASGKAFGFWNLDHMEVFGYADTKAFPGFCPLWSTETGKLMAGIRFWFIQRDNETTFKCTLYEPDGYTEFIQPKANGEVKIDKEKRGYVINVVKTEAMGVEEMTEENYEELPIVPLYANDDHESELVGFRESIDCYDLIKSGFANDIDDMSGVFWLLENTQGMDDPDLAKFIQRLKTVRAAVVDEDGASARAETVEVPVEARKAMLDILRSDIYDDFQAVDFKSLSNGSKTEQEIQSTYQAMDDKCADFQYHILKFVKQIMRIAGVDDEPSLKWNKVINQTEITSMVLMAAQYLPEETVVQLLPFLSPEQVDYVNKEMEKRQMEQFHAEEEEEIEEEGVDDDTVEDAKKAASQKLRKKIR